MNVKMKCYRYPRVNVEGKRSETIEVYDDKLIQTTIKEKLFYDMYDYVLIKYTNYLYICEKSGVNTYNRREILYHPDMKDLQ